MGAGLHPAHTGETFPERVMNGLKFVGALLAVTAVSISAPELAVAQAAADALASAEPTRPHDFNFIAMPIPISDPAVGNGLAVGVGGLYRAGGSDRPWVTGLGVFYTDNQSRGVALVQKAYLSGERFRVAAAGGWLT